MGVVHRDCESTVREGLGGGKRDGIYLAHCANSSARSPEEVLAHLWDVHRRSAEKKDTPEKTVETINDHPRSCTHGRL